MDPSVQARDLAVRARAARQIRHRLVQMEPVILVAPRWSEPGRFLDDLATDLVLDTRPRGAPQDLLSDGTEAGSVGGVECRTLSLAPLQGRTVHESWTWLLHGLAGYCDVSLDGPAAQAVTGAGFRAAVLKVFERAALGARRVLLVHGIEHLLVEARDDLFRAFEAHSAEFGPDRRINLLFCGSVDAPSFALVGARRHILPDFGPDEATHALIDLGATLSDDALRQVVGLVGGVPALLAGLAAAAERASFDPTEEGLLRALGALNDEIRGAVAIVSAVDGLAERLEAIAAAGVSRNEPRWDAALLRSGLIRHADGPPGHVALRAPLFVRLASMAYG